MSFMTARNDETSTDDHGHPSAEHGTAHSNHWTQTMTNFREHAIALFVILLVTLAVSTVTCNAADAAVVAQLPFSQEIRSLVVASDGTAWVGISSEKDAEVGHALADGRFVTTRVAVPSGDRSVFGLTAAIGPDGRVWFGALDRWLYRVDADQRIVPVGPFAGSETTGTAMALGDDGTLWAVTNSQEILHVSSDGTHWTSGIPAAPCSSADYYSIARATDGAMWLGDLGCRRLVRIASDGTTVTSLDRAYPAIPDALSPAPQGAMWFLASNVDLVGRVTSTGQLATFGALDPPNDGIATGPDGTAWYSGDLECGLTHLATDGAQRHVNGPVVPKKVAFGPDGTLWMVSARRVVHMTVQSLDQFHGSCDRTGPIVTSHPDLTRSVSLQSLRRGLSVHVSEAANVSFETFFSVDGDLRKLPRVSSRLKFVRQPRRTVHFQFPAPTLNRIHRFLAQGLRVTMEVAHVTATDYEGNPGEAPRALPAHGVVIGE
jgi:virginiamycin B lyase